ncbi:UDP-glucose 4-epimerase GalE [Thermoanaerobacterium thermosaccharolyticum]|jgi:UDP-glucose 4-epimerase|uniref:UDP-glucose 4-epimerase n=1 Tax=Thermoanaerobacterium thermosaccharolyticum M0795 TaxID=698948 RepID=L0IK81_THETR|nr:UDP-glucose 4-epimerase GalE [Thermoanaerobacterium thermosaccharolyticum]AGB18362.1 UDP-glucose-4-epimerase [Thermoanaerobacterium thermosaccharolyticum M0795]MBE0067579.1 UDP-glucose 4-epimerase GalE [Thermoanaerobacterium thermosaccharolyticum]MBE0227163.1 UDP-glucose 4-epimerase GalE [Thermoanaerobacterium thermosaccharolyticum]TCW34590.1 UDP-glucose 4-epimerase [Thermohydrogenium kirishiense]
MAILVCGGAGYIGSHTAYELFKRGEDVIVVDNLITGHKKAVLGGKLYIGDLRDSEFMDKIFEQNDIEAVIDFAAFSLVGESVGKPLEYYENNVYGTMCLLKKMVKYGVKKIVFSSTAATYGEPERVPIKEDDTTFPTNPYGETKLAVEKMLKWCDNAYGIKHVVLRYFNVAGADESGMIGEDHNPETHLIPLILQVPLGKRDLINVFGDDYETKDGTCIRDYIHVTDLADAHILALNKLRRDNSSATYNLGNGEGFTVNEVIDAARRVTGHPIPAKVVARRPGDPAKLVASSDKIINELGWNPKHNSLEEIIESAWKWHKSNPNGFDDK